MLSIHVIADNATNEQLDMAFNFLVALQSIFPNKQLVVNVAAGAQLDKGMQFVERVRGSLPNIIIIWRHLEDTGIHAVLTVPDWYNSRILPRLTWFKQYRVIILLDNESSGSDAQIKYYVQWEIAALSQLHQVGLFGVVARFATGNIGDGTNGTTMQYPLLKPLFDALMPGDMVSPNEYTNFPGKSSSGHLARWKLMETAAGKKLPITIGEAGLLDNYAARAGWVGKVNEAVMLALLIDNEQWYREDIVRCLYCIGGFGEWVSLQLTQSFLNLLLDYYRKNKPVATPVEVIKHLSTGTNVNFRATPDALGTILYKIAVGEYTVVAIDSPIVQGNYHWQKIRLANGDVGYIALEVVTLTDIPVTPDPVINGDVAIDKVTLDSAKEVLTDAAQTLQAIADKLELDLIAVQADINAALIKLQTAH